MSRSATGGINRGDKIFLLKIFLHPWTNDTAAAAAADDLSDVSGPVSIKATIRGYG